LSSSTDLYKSFHGWKACTDVTREKYAERILIKEKMDKQKAARRKVVFRRGRGCEWRVKWWGCFNCLELYLPGDVYLCFGLGLGWVV
jgi:hypothetical protein